MKNLVTILFFTVLVSFAMVSCKNDEPDVYWYSYGTYYESDEFDNGFYINLDNGNRLVPIESSSNNPDLKDKSKVLVEYVIVSEEGTTVNAKVSGIGDILTKDVLQLTEENKDSIGNDGVIVYDGDIWLSERHLNVPFSYFGYAYGPRHFINLVQPIGEQLDDDGNQILELRHNANDDNPNARYSSLVAFDMWSLYEEGMDSINFAFRSMDYDSTRFTYIGTYFFNGEAPMKNAIRISPEFFEQVY